VEVVFKVLYAIVVLAIACALIASVVSVCRSQVDLAETVRRWFKKASPLENVISVRDPSAIYQDGGVVGLVTGSVDQDDGVFVFRQLAETAGFRSEKPFEYGRERYRVLRIGSASGIKVIATPTGSTARNAVLEDVVCELVR
jgi:hypothetical protein